VTYSRRRRPAWHLLVTPRETARLLSVSERTLWGITFLRGDLLAIRLNPVAGGARSIRYAVDGLRDWIARQRAAQSNGRG
jgi:hypothetical protein